MLRQAAFSDETVDVRSTKATSRADIRLARAIEVQHDACLASQELGASCLWQGVGVDRRPLLGTHLARHGHMTGPNVCTNASAFGHAGSSWKSPTGKQE
jgi:hypothetical protein